MSVDFSWHLEEDVPPVSEDEPRPEGRPRRRWLRHVLLLAAILLVAAAALGYGYYYRHQQQLVEEFQRVLDREIAFWRTGRYEEARLQLVLDTERWDTRKGSYAILGFYGVTMLPMTSYLPPLTVSRVELHGDMARVWIEWEDGGTRYMRVHFYRRVDGLWKRTVPDAQFWGREQSVEGALLHWTFYERDAPYVRPLVDWAEQAGQTVISDFGLAHVPRLRVQFVYKVDRMLFDSASRENKVVLPALLMSRVRVDKKLDRMHQAMIGWAYVDHALEQVAPSQPSIPMSPYPSSYYMFRSAVLQWEVARVAVPLWKEIPGLYSLELDNLPTLRALFSVPPSWPDGDPLIYVVSLASFIGERYGAPKVIALLVQLKETPSFPRALAETLGPDFDLETFEQEWHTYLRERADWFQPAKEFPRQ